MMSPPTAFIALVILQLVSASKIYFIGNNSWKFYEARFERGQGAFQLMQILDLLGMYFNAAVVFVTNFLLLFILALAILWLAIS